MLVSQNSERHEVCQCNLRLSSHTNRMCPGKVSQPDGGSSRLDGKRAWDDCGGTAAAATAGTPGARQRNEKSYKRNELCAFVAKCTNEFANHKLQSVKLQFPKCTLYNGVFQKMYPGAAA